eukprot:gene7651-7714_t
MEKGIAIIGAGHGGVQAAASLREGGYDGPLTLICNEPDLPYHKPPLSKAFLKTPDHEPQILRPESFYTSNNIDLRLNTRVSAIEPSAKKLTIAGGATIDFDKLILATGTRSRILPIAGHDLEGCFLLRSLQDAAKLRDAVGRAQDVVVIGGGFIGLEVAATMAILGKRVTVLEAGERVLGRAVAPLISAHMTKVHQDLGIKVLLNAKIERIDGVGKVSGVVMKDGSRFAADLVLISVGAEPNVELAAAANIACNNGIVVGADLQSSYPDVYAIGDCALYRHWHAGRDVRLESVQNASDQGKLVARNILGAHDVYQDVPWFWSDQGPVKLQMTGLNFTSNRSIVQGVPEDNSFSVYHFQDERLLSVDSVNRGADHMLGRRMIAAGFNPSDQQIAGGATELKAALAAFKPA